jgi:hypothetical protein
VRNRSDLNPLKLVNCAVAQRLGEHPPNVPITDDFLAFATEHELTEEIFELRSYAPSAAVAVYEQRGWLRFPDEFLWRAN